MEETCRKEVQSCVVGVIGGGGGGGVLGAMVVVVVMFQKRKGTNSFKNICSSNDTCVA